MVDDELVRNFRQWAALVAEGLENSVIPLAICLQFRFAARLSKICPLKLDGVSLEKRSIVWPGSKTGGNAKPTSKE